MVRIAISGTHQLGKSTLVSELGERLPDHTLVPEPYELLEDLGRAFDHPPSIEDYVAQLRQSIDVLRSSDANLIVDRCPLDFLGYIYASRGARRFDVEMWRADIQAALDSLDLLVALRVEPTHEPHIFVEDARFRLAVDGCLRDIVDGDDLDLCGGVDILPLGGPWDARVDAVLDRLERFRSNPR